MAEVTLEVAQAAVERSRRRIAEIEAELPKVRRQITELQKRRQNLQNERYGAVKTLKLLVGEEDDE
jgi:hypothetical protein